MSIRIVRGCTFAVALALVYSVAPGQSKHAAFPPELVRFKPFGKEPIFIAESGHWDAKIRERGWVLQDGDTWKLWYTGYAEPNGLRLLGYATSKDGLTWTRHPGNPLIKDFWVEDMMVVKDGGKYWMFAEGKDDLAQLLVSDDGVRWKRVGQLDVRKKSGEPIEPGPYGTPTAFKEGDVWYLFYERGDLGVWLATSSDMKVWTNVQDEPVLKTGPGEYDKDQIAVNQVIKYKGRYYAYYHGSASTGPNAKKWSAAIASSPDLVNWTKYAGNPLQPVEQNKSSGIVVPVGNAFRLYTMHPQVFVHTSEP
jgi:predicted GH43/DUF377 family glycosyl hydrolase